MALDLENDDLELLLQFVLREKRYLRKRETSFSEAQLTAGKNIIKNALTTIRGVADGKKDLNETLVKVGARTELVGKVARKMGKKMEKAQVKLVVENYELFNAVFGKTVKVSNLQIDRSHNDRYYAPKKHEYK